MLKRNPPCSPGNSALESIDNNCPDGNSDQINSASDQILVPV